MRRFGRVHEEHLAGAQVEARKIGVCEGRRGLNCLLLRVGRFSMLPSHGNLRQFPHF